MTQATPMTQSAQGRSVLPPRTPTQPTGGPKTLTRRDQSSPVDQPAVSALLRLRSKWIVAGAVLGAVLGLVFSLVFEAGRYTAETVLEVAPNTSESQRAAQLAQSVNVLAGSSPVINAAAQETGVSSADLRRRSQVIWEDSTSIVTITVSARTSQAAMEQATALAESTIELNGSSTTTLLSELTSKAQEVLVSGALTDPVAEDNRRSGLGTALAQQQGSALGAATQIEVINPADSASPSGITPPIGAALGGFAGLALVAALAVLLPVGRHRVKNNQEVVMLAPSLRLHSRRPAHEQAGRLMESSSSVLAVLAMPGAEESARQFADRVVRVLGAHALAAQLVDARDGLSADQAAVLRRGERIGDGRFRVLVCPATEESIELLAGQSEILTAIVAVPRRTRLEDLQDVATAVATTRPAAVLWS